MPGLFRLTNLYLQHNSHHHPANKQSALASLIHRTEALCSLYPLTQELEFLPPVFKDNKYGCLHIRRSLQPATHTATNNDKPTSNVFIPHTQTTCGRISRMVAKRITKSVALPPSSTYSYFPPVKNALEFKTPAVYSITCECGKVYIGKSGRSIQIRIKQHNRHTRQQIIQQ